MDAHFGRTARYTRGCHRSRHRRGEHRPGAGDAGEPRSEQPPAHQDAQDPGAGEAADGGGRGRHHLPEARRGGGDGRCGRRRRYPAHLQRAGRGQDRAARRADPAPQAHGGRARQRGGGARAIRGRQASRRRHPLPDRVRHRLRPQWRAEPASGARPRARDDAAAEHALRGPDDVSDRQARTAARGSNARCNCSTARAFRCRSCRAAARPR